MTVAHGLADLTPADTSVHGGANEVFAVLGYKDSCRG
jgi:hypothetical protein